MPARRLAERDTVGGLETSESYRRKCAMAIEACELYYADPPWEQKNIAKKLKVSAASVSRLLGFAAAQRLVRFSIHPPRDLALAREVFGFVQGHGIREVIVAGTNRRHVGQAAAAYFQQYARSRQTIVLDGGLTVEEFVNALPGGGLAALQVVPLCADPISYHVASCELMARFSTKYPGCDCVRNPQYRSEKLDAIREKVVAAARAAAFVVLGVGPWQKNFTALTFVEHLGLDPDELQQEEPRIAAVCGYCFLDKDGGPVRLQKVDEKLPRSLAFEDLQELARSNRCRIVLLAHSKEKRDAVWTAIRAHLCNSLIIDQRLAIALTGAMGRRGR